MNKKRGRPPSKARLGIKVTIICVGVGIFSISILPRPTRKMVPYLEYRASKPTSPPTILTANPDALEWMVDAMIADLDPALSKNAYFPVFAREKLGQMFAEKRAHKFVIEKDDKLDPTASSALMSPTIQNRIPGIRLYMPRFRYLFETLGQSDLTKNTVLVALVHELTHWENAPFIQKEEVKKTNEEVLEEEFRVHRKVSWFVVMQLRERGQPLIKDVKDIDDILKRCGYGGVCPELKAYLVRSGLSVQR